MTIRLIISFLAVLPISAQQVERSRSSDSNSFWSTKEKLHLYFFNSKNEELILIDEGSRTPRYGSLGKAMNAKGCSAGINGGYFGADAAKTPIGLSKEDSKTHSPFAKGAFTVSGTLYDTGSGLKLERSNALTAPISSMKMALQAGPFLIDNGKVVAGLNKNRRAARSFIATDGKGQWCIGVSTPLTLHELASWLAQEKWAHSFKIKMALNLDGGGSSCLWTKKSGNLKTSHRSLRNYLGVRPAKSN